MNLTARIIYIGVYRQILKGGELTNVSEAAKRLSNQHVSPLGRGKDGAVCVCHHPQMGGGGTVNPPFDMWGHQQGPPHS